MHDPMTQAFRIQLPRLIPRKKAWSRLSRWTWTLATVWHRDPSGHDSTTCGYKDYIKHIHHWRLQFDLWQTIRRRYLDRCVWCNGHSAKGDYVNISNQWDPEPDHWWGHKNAFHQDCHSIWEAHIACICEDGIYDSELSGWGYGNCAKCGKRREWRSDDRRVSPVDNARRLLATIPKGQRDPAKTEQVQQMWKAYREVTGAW